MKSNMIEVCLVHVSREEICKTQKIITANFIRLYIKVYYECNYKMQVAHAHRRVLSPLPDHS